MILKSLTLLIVIYFLNVKEVFSQSPVGEYSYSGDHITVEIALFPNGTFSYDDYGQILPRYCRGNWHVRGQDLILDSSPQKDKILCYEYRKGKEEYTYFNVRKKSTGFPTLHDLFIIMNSGDTIQLKSQFKGSKIRSKDVKGFFIVDLNMTRSPTYLIQQKQANWFDILFEDKRVFENEDWRITETGLQPRNDVGEYQNFLLKRNAHEYRVNR